MSRDLFERPSTADTGTRNDHDYYETPVWMTRALLQHHPLSGLVFEPCAGDGAIARTIRMHGRLSVVTNDIDPRHFTDFHHDAAGFDLWAHHGLAMVDWVITNPPFNLGFPILMQAERLARVGVAMLLRKTFLEPTKERGPWFVTHPPTNMIGLQRHNFRGKGSDSVSTDWYIWRRGPQCGAPFIIDADAKSRLA